MQSIFVTRIDAFKHGGSLVHVFQGMENHGLVSLNQACFVLVSWVLAENLLARCSGCKASGSLAGNYRRVDNGLEVGETEPLSGPKTRASGRGPWGVYFDPFFYRGLTERPSRAKGERTQKPKAYTICMREDHGVVPGGLDDEGLKKIDLLVKCQDCRGRN